jgi:short-subunit dehydrogenase
MKTHFALVTGASSGMGLEFARQLAQRGYNLLIVSNVPEIHEAAEELSKIDNRLSVIPLVMDLGQQNSARELYEYTRAHELEVEVLVNNAGVYHDKDILDDSEGFTGLIMNLHMYTPAMLCYLFGQDMKQRRKGYILNMSSMAAQLPTPGITVYAATKAYLKSFSKSMYFEMRPYGVGVTTVLPAAIATPLYRLKPSLMKLGVATGVIHTPRWLVRRALRGMLRRRHVVKPSLMNYYLPLLIKLLPNSLETKIWNKFKEI